MAPRKQPQRLAAVSIGYGTYLLPAANAAKVVALLAEAVECDDRFDADEGRTYIIGKPITLAYALVRPSQVRPSQERAPDDAPLTVAARITERSGVQGLLPAPDPLWRKLR